MYPSETQPERFADGVVHAVSLVGFSIASVFLMFLAAEQGSMVLFAATLIYVSSIFASISVSFAYHLLPRHDIRHILQRWDHAAIYVLIASTFSPLLIKVATTSGYVILSIVWAFAVIGFFFKLFARNIKGRWSLISYLGLGWFALIALPDLWMQLPKATTFAMLAGGVFYTIGTLFYRSKAMRFRYPIWHAFGMLGGGSFFTAIWIAMIA